MICLNGPGQDDEEEEEEDQEIHRERMPIELEPDHKGTEIRLEGIKTMQGQIVAAATPQRPCFFSIKAVQQFS